MYIVLDIRPSVPLVVGIANDEKGAKALSATYVDSQQQIAKAALGHGQGEPQNTELWRDEEHMLIVEAKKHKK